MKRASGTPKAAAVARVQGTTHVHSATRYTYPYTLLHRNGGVSNFYPSLTWGVRCPSWLPPSHMGRVVPACLPPHTRERESLLLYIQTEPVTLRGGSATIVVPAGQASAGEDGEDGELQTVSF